MCVHSASDFQRQDQRIKKARLSTSLCAFKNQRKNTDLHLKCYFPFKKVVATPARVIVKSLNQTIVTGMDKLEHPR